MTNPCSPSTSIPDPSRQNVVVFGSLALGSYLNNRGMAWAYGIAPAIGTLTFDLPTFCAADPPSVPTITATNILDWFNPLNPQGAAQLKSIMGQLISAFLWYDLCVCSGGGTLTPPTAVADPSGQEINPTGLTALAATPCMTIDDPKILKSILCFPNASGVNDCEIISGSIPTTSYLPLNGSGPYTIHIAWTNNESGSNSSTSESGSVVYLDSTGTTLRTDAITWFFSGNQFFVAPSGTTQIQVQGPSRSPVPAAGHFCFTKFDVFCGGQSPGGSTTPCCPPDPALAQVVESILNSVTLIQRQLAPFAYIAGATHTGVSGTGTIAVSGLLGVKIDLTTLPTQLGQRIGEPDYIFDAGWVSVLDANGFVDERRIRAVNQVWLPRIMSEATLVGYSLHDGVIATLTELEREP